MRAWLAAALVLLAQAAPAQGPGKAPGRAAGGVTGVVTSVVDGDSLWVTPAGGGKPIEVRLAGIDAPEICQEHGAESKAFLAELVLKKTVRLVAGGRDPYGRTLGHVHVDGVEVNRRLVEEGQAWSLRVKWDQGPYVSQERMARALSRGLHKAGANAITPKDFRVRHGPCEAAASAPTAAPASPPTSPSPMPAAPARARPAAVAPVSSAFRCDGRTHCSQMTSCDEATFFLRNCPGVQMDGNHDGVPCERQWCRR